MWDRGVSWSQFSLDIAENPLMTDGLRQDKVISSLREDDIRPDHLMAGQARAFAQDIQRMVRLKSTFVRVQCPVCDARSSKKEFEKYGLTYERCPACNTLFMNPRPPPDVLEGYYQNSENYRYWNTYIFPASENARRERIFNPRAEKVASLCRHYHVPTDTVMEIGSGFGTFCEALRDLKIVSRIIAVEPTPELAASCRERGLEVIDKPFEQVEIDRGSIDVITSFEVIEHLFHPRSFIAKCARSLISGGLLVITCPNIEGFETMVLGSSSDTIDVEHLNYFNPASISMLLEGYDFDILEVTTPGKLDAELVRKKILSGQFDPSTQPFLKHVLMDDWDRLGTKFQEFISENGLSSHMWVVARKR